MDRVRNPFRPGAGTMPTALVGRDEVLENAQVALARVKRGTYGKSFLFVGLRGVGKTVLLNAIERMADREGYKTILVEAPEGERLPTYLSPSLRQVLLSLDRLEQAREQVKRALRVLQSFWMRYGNFEVGYDALPERGVADSGNIEQDLSDLLIAVAEAGKSRDVPIALIIDEVQYLSESEFSALLVAIHKINQRELPLILIGAGLPQVVGLAGRAKSYAERLFDFPNVGPLTERQTGEALQKPAQKEGASFTEGALMEVAHVTKGYPYFIQVWGSYCWDTAEFSPIDVDVIHGVKSIVVDHLDNNFFRVRYDRLTPREKDYLRAMAELGPDTHRSGDIAEVLGIHVQSAAPIRNSLIKKGMIYSPNHGDTAFTVPLFDDFMKRIMPELPRKRGAVSG